MEDISLTLLGLQSSSIYIQSELETIGSNNSLPDSRLPDYSTTRELIFVDSGIENYQSLIPEATPNARVVLLDSTQDGIEQINEILCDFSHRYFFNGGFKFQRAVLF